MKNKTVKTLCIIDAVLLMLCVAANIAVVFMLGSKSQMSVYDCINSLIKLLVCTFGVYYILSGCEKGEGTVLFRLYMGLFAVSQAVVVIGTYGKNMPEAVLTITSVVVLLIISFVRDLGEKKSKILSAVVLISTLAVVAVRVFSGNADNYVLTRVITSAVVGISCPLLIIAKYEDKKSRGSK